MTEHRDSMYEDPEAADENVVHHLVPGGNIEAAIARNDDAYAGLADRIMEDVAEYDLNPEDCFRIWEAGLYSFAAFAPPEEDD